MKQQPVKFTFCTRAEAQACRALVKGIVQVVSQWIVRQQLLDDLDLLLTEACANAVRHAYPPDSPGCVEIAVKLLPGKAVVCSISDWGDGFRQCPLDLQKPIPLCPPEAESGRGLYIISNLVDKFAILQKDNKNTLRVTINLGSEAWAASA